MQTAQKKLLLQYSAFSASFLMMQSMQAQVAHTDFDPYLQMDVADYLAVDLDDDGNNDVRFILYKSMGSSSGDPGFGFYAEALGDAQLAVSPLDNVAFSSTGYSIDCYFAAALGVREINENIAISAADEWGAGTVMGRGMTCGDYGAWGQQGEWIFEGTDVRDYYVGVLINNPDPHYAWVRLRHNGTTDYIKDFVIDNGPATVITTPDLFNHIAPAAQDAVLSTEAVTHAFQIQFNSANDEDSLMEYRVILRNTIYTDPMTATKCEITQPGNYVSVPKSGGPYAIDISSLTTDWAGNNLVEGQTYKAYIYSRYNYPVTLLNGLAGPTNELEYVIPTVGVEENIASEISLFYNGNVIHILSASNINTIHVYDIAGREIIRGIPQQTGNNEYTFPFNSVPGVYLITCNTPLSIFTKQIVVL